MEKIIIGEYHITDCEHIGDIHREINFLKNVHNSIKIINSYWDKKDCGEAYITFSFNSKYFAEIYDKIDARYNEDINDYIVVKQETNDVFANAKLYKYNDYKVIYNHYRCFFDDTKITLELFFEETSIISNAEIVSKAINVLGVKTTIILGYTKYKVDDSNYVRVLLQTLIENVSHEKLKAFGDYCLGKRGWLHDNHIYGEIRINSILKDYCKYNDFVTLIKTIADKKPLKFKCLDYYRSSFIDIEHDKYLNDDNTINDTININGFDYKLVL